MTSPRLFLVTALSATFLFSSAPPILAQGGASPAASQAPAGAAPGAPAGAGATDNTAIRRQRTADQPITRFERLTLIVGYAATTLIAGYALVILVWIASGKLNISRLISEADGAASLSRFQFLIFTFIIGFSLLLVILGGADGPAFPPHIPVGIFALLGISAGSYVVSKGIQKGVEKPAETDDRVAPDNPNAG